jgi:hypothetical protein
MDTDDWMRNAAGQGERAGRRCFEKNELFLKMTSAFFGLSIVEKKFSTEKSRNREQTNSVSFLL